MNQERINLGLHVYVNVVDRDRYFSHQWTFFWRVLSRVNNVKFFLLS